MMRRHGDPAEMARTSTLVRAWKRRVAEKAAGDPLADEHWYAHLQGISRPVPRPACDYCEDTGMVILDCTIRERCNGRICENRDKRSDPNWTHTFVRACDCPAGQGYNVSFGAASKPDYPRPVQPARRTTYGFTRATEGRR